MKKANTKLSIPKRALTKKEIEEKKQLAYILYMSGEQQNMIADYIGMNPKTISQWSTEGKWKDKRSAATITRPELVNKILQSIGQLLDKNISGEDVGNLEDKLAKFAKMIEALDKKTNPVHAMEWFKLLNQYIMSQMTVNKEATPAFVKLLNQFQIAYINSIMNHE